MRSSPSRSVRPPEGAAQPAHPGPPVTPPHEILPFLFPEVPSGAATFRPQMQGPAESGDPTQAAHAAEGEKRARAAGREEGRAESRRNFEEQLAEERSTLAAALAQFAQDRAVYYQKVESEVVQLALSIARKILHREAEVDPLLLAGVVRVAVEKIERATGVTLRIHPHNAADWRRYFSMHMDPADLPEIVEDPAIAPDRCILETSMGVAELGMEVQLKEIEKGMMDLLAARPEKTP